MSCFPPAVQEHSAGSAPYEPWGHEGYWEQSDGEGWVSSAPFLLAKEAEPVPKGPAKKGDFSLSTLNKQQTLRRVNGTWGPFNVLLISNRAFPGDKPIHWLMEFINALQHRRAGGGQRSPAATIDTLFPRRSRPFHFFFFLS